MLTRTKSYANILLTWSYLRLQFWNEWMKLLRRTIRTLILHTNLNAQNVLNTKAHISKCFMSEILRTHRWNFNEQYCIYKIVTRWNLKKVEDESSIQKLFSKSLIVELWKNIFTKLLHCFYHVQTDFFNYHIQTAIFHFFFQKWILHIQECYVAAHYITFLPCFGLNATNCTLQWFI